MSKKIQKRKLILIDDHPVMRQGFAKIIEEEPDLEICAQFATAKGVVAGVHIHRPDLVIVDIGLQDAHGLELIKDLRNQFPDLRLMVFSIYEESIFAERSLRAGAHGYVMKRTSPDEVLEAIRRVLDGEVWVSGAVRNRILKSSLTGRPFQTSLVAGLTDREVEVLQLIGRGHRSREIAEILKISVKTVETHRAHLKEKLDLKDTTQLTHFAMQWAGQTF